MNEETAKAGIAIVILPRFPGHSVKNYIMNQTD